MSAPSSHTYRSTSPGIGVLRSMIFSFGFMAFAFSGLVSVLGTLCPDPLSDAHAGRFGPRLIIGVHGVIKFQEISFHW